MNKTKTNVRLSIVMLLLLLTGCGEKTQTPASEAAQQQPLTQKIGELLKKAETGDADAQADLGDAYARGDGLPKDAAKAVDFLRKAAEKGIARAQFQLGQLYAKGDGVPQDAVRATDLVKQSARNGYARAQAALGQMYAKGEGVTRDEVLAYVWSSLALAQGEQDAKQVQESVSLNTALHDEAERLKAKWQRGLEIVREKQEAAVPAQPVKPSGVKW